MSHSQNKKFFHFVAKIFDFVEKICYNIINKKYITKRKDIRMLNICMYSDNIQDIDTIRSHIQDFFIDNKIMGKVSSFQKGEEFLTVPGSYDVYFMDMDSTEADVCELGSKMKSIDAGSYYIYICGDNTQAHRAANADCDFYMAKPIDVERLRKILSKIRAKIKQEYIIIPTPIGDRRESINNINYVDIVKRCLCYHLKDGEMFDGQTLRSSFQKAITPLDQHEQFIFLSPSLLINLYQIKILDLDHLYFDNDEVLYFPRKAHDTIEQRWKQALGIK